MYIIYIPVYIVSQKLSHSFYIFHILYILIVTHTLLILVY